ncbi:hydroxyacylglutathione hydrolase [Uliginosibacterium gangwonense]|uniref:hydroxyacylglutathione hydrolase n=1 Tax=Uliginosibacterium gangwonense TaxID=392736 RepID=UPI000363BCD5|nr:hydroxyacylglutathione hydrolase [Uliginosibacterium gangwonense]
MEIVPLSALRDNYIWTLNRAGVCVAVDPSEATPVLAHLTTTGQKLVGILLTHRHADHVGGMTDLIAACGELAVYGPDSAQMRMVTHPVKDGMHLTIRDIEASITVWAVPGHTEEHVAYLCDTALFCGDTLFGAGCGRLLGGTAMQLHASLERIRHLPPLTHIYCAHEYTLANLRFAQAVEPGNGAITERIQVCEVRRQQGRPTLPSTLAQELETNPFLRTHIPAVKQAAQKQTRLELDSDLAVFTALRAWKDHF